jgi:hypothetical protein
VSCRVAAVCMCRHCQGALPRLSASCSACELLQRRRCAAHYLPCKHLPTHMAHQPTHLAHQPASPGPHDTPHVVHACPSTGRRASMGWTSCTLSFWSCHLSPALMQQLLPS